MKIRVKELRYIRAGDIRPHPNNWRVHPRKQVKQFEKIVEDIGFADVLIAYEANDGVLTLIDGHMRAGTNPDEILPTVILDVDDDEAEALLASIDPIGEMARANQEKLDQVMDNLRADVRERMKELPHVKREVERIAGHGPRPERRLMTCPECGAEF